MDKRVSKWNHLRKSVRIAGSRHKTIIPASQRSARSIVRKTINTLTSLRTIGIGGIHRLRKYENKQYFPSNLVYLAEKELCK